MRTRKTGRTGRGRWDKCWLRTRLPYVDVFIRQGFKFFVKLLAIGTRPSTSNDFVQLFRFRERFYSTVGGLGWDAGGYTGGQALPGIPYVGGMLGIKNSLSGPFEDILAAKAEAFKYLDKSDVDKAREVLEAALYQELHHPDSDIPYNTAYLYRGLSQVAERRQDWPLALQHWNQALKIENNAGYKKSWRECSNET
jgi:tetratricopeptide (TPR) repeat protein